MKNFGAPLPVGGGGTGVSTALAGQVFAGPASGTAAAPGFRGLVAADLPALADGCCRLSVASTTSLALKPYGGNTLWVGGQACTIPSGGVTYTASGLATGTLYYVYVTASGGAVNALVLSTTGHITGADGREYFNNAGVADTTKRMAGMVATNSAAAPFLDTTANRWCLNWFNRRLINGRVSAAGVQTASGGYTGLAQGSMLVWPDEAVSARLSGYVSTGSSSTQVTTGIFSDFPTAGTLVQVGSTSTTIFGSSGAAAAAAEFQDYGFGEGLRTFQIVGRVSANSATWYTDLNVTTRG